MALKTGLIIEAELENGELNNFSVKRVSVQGEEWVDNEFGQFNIVDANKWVDLMVEGITTVIYTAHEGGIKDSAAFLREVIHKLEQSFIKPADVNVDENSERKEYTGRYGGENDVQKKD